MKYKLEQLCCPSCGAKINLDINGKKSIFCPFCGSQIAIDDGNRVVTKNINIHKRYTNDAAVEKQLVKDRENERQHKEYKWTMIGLLIFIIVDFLFLGIFIMKDEWDEKKSIEAGMIQVGQSSTDMEGKKYQAVEEYFESAGFINITTIDLDDAGWRKKEDTVESVSIGGESSFSSSEYFFPDTKVIITYH